MYNICNLHTWFNCIFCCTIYSVNHFSVTVIFFKKFLVCFSGKKILEIYYNGLFCWEWLINCQKLLNVKFTDNGVNAHLSLTSLAFLRPHINIRRYLFKLLQSIHFPENNFSINNFCLKFLINQLFSWLKYFLYICLARFLHTFHFNVSIFIFWKLINKKRKIFKQLQLYSLRNIRNAETDSFQLHASIYVAVHVITIIIITYYVQQTANISK